MQNLPACIKIALSFACLVDDLDDDCFMNREKLENYLEQNPFAKLSDVVTQILYDEIVVLDIPPASKLNINQIATDLGISRTPVVEAINRLQAIGFVETKPRTSGFYVTDMNLRDMIDLYDARTAIEQRRCAPKTPRPRR